MITQEWIKQFATLYLPETVFIIFEIMSLAFCSTNFLNLPKTNDAISLKQVRLVDLQGGYPHHNALVILVLITFAYNMVSLQLTPPFCNKFHSSVKFTVSFII